MRGETAELQKTAEPNVITFAEFSKVDTENFRQILCLTLKEPGKQNVLDAIDALMKHPDVISAEPDYVISLASTENEDPYRGNQWAIEAIQLEQAWDYATSSAIIRVGVVDSGIDASHPDLSGKVNTNLSRDFTWGSIMPVNTVDDGNGHGTHVAGIIGAVSDNGIGVSGVCPQIELVSLKAFNEDGTGHYSWLIKVMEYASEVSIPILNMSLSWGVSDTENAQALVDLNINNNTFLEKLDQYNGLIVCSAGNDGINIDTTASYPASFSSNKIISVGSFDPDNTISSFSNYGDENIDLFAPGVDILSCFPYEKCENNCQPSNYDGVHLSTTAVGYHYMDGTSMAAPFVTGVVALVMANYPSLTPAQVKARIMNSVDSVPALSALCLSGGSLNAFNAVHTHNMHYVKTIRYHSYCCDCGLAYPRELHTYELIFEGLYRCNVCGYETSVTPILMCDVPSTE